MLQSSLLKALGLSTVVLYSYAQAQSGLFFHVLYLAVMMAALWNDYASYETLHERITKLEKRTAILQVKEIIRSFDETKETEQQEQETKEPVKEEVVAEADEDEEALSANTSAWRSIDISEWERTR